VALIRCMAVLFERAPTLHSLDTLLRPLGAVHTGAGGLALEVDGREVAVEVVARRWSGEEFQRALDHPWTCRDSRRVAPAHQAFVRLVLPAGDAAIAEWMLLTRTVAALAPAAGALCAFTPAGEALRSFQRVQGGLRSLGSAPAPVDLWVNTRLAALGPRWQAMDTIGMAQLDRTDLVALYETERTSYRAADAFLRNLCLYVLEHDLGDGDRIPGPDGAEWEVRASGQALLPPERATLQLAAVGGPDLGVVVKG